jgi:hypothetical protein
VSDTPITDAAYDAVRAFTNEEQAVDALIELRETSRKLERENAALRADKERLDSGRILLRCHDSFQGWQSVEFIGQDLRDAIDAARKAQP